MASRKEFNGNTNGSEVAAAFADRIKGRTIPRGLEGDRVYLYKLGQSRSGHVDNPGCITRSGVG
ncbi:hypothetical protein KVT40_006295 [Elsinoe batatas]|uniref:Uncharacterized protein n=1 Tax=Elsinoe batatas TaxID=2601811 RepID=A0A8K0KXP0_9PEZI|nr:hypothetical protein KVT40_006295 [Elsinoe batatas]